MATIYIENAATDETMVQIVEFVQSQLASNCNLSGAYVTFERDSTSWIDCKDEDENDYAELLQGIFSVIRSNS
jgi:hypothetical protein